MELAERYMPLADGIACRRARSLPPNVTLEEIRSAAYYALVDAARRFDPGRGVSFPTYARIRISGEITDLLSSSRPSVDDLNDVPDRCSNSDSDTSDFFDFVSLELGEEDGKMLRMYYVDGRSLKEVGLSRGVGEARASQIMKDCRSRLRRALARRGHA